MSTAETANVAAFYDAFGPGNVLGERSMYINLGYWDDGATDYDHACERLAEELGKLAELAAGQDQLDIGFGFGDQAMFWANRFGLRRIVGLNIARTQVELARRRAAERGLDGRVDFRRGSATAMPVGDASFDAVTSLESAHHYGTREDFFEEAYRVLRPGGVLAIADIIPRNGAPAGIAARVGQVVRRVLLQSPQANFYPISTYIEKLRSAGFQDIETRSIRDRTFPAFTRFTRKRFLDGELVRRMDPALAGLVGKGFARIDFWGTLDYVLVRARKPNAPLSNAVNDLPAASTSRSIDGLAH
jgi:erythromycin 3''-O-methyltransferase